ncbi:hypothetical protein SCUCBS95973_005988 [Sporothrix curviconia]|uniref:2EXR domain-containing protein n=1 Tax=Sporothrix curviconia TaxID=1260050 RepID=A0ABP0C1F1_9PEZI
MAPSTPASPAPSRQPPPPPPPPLPALMQTALFIRRNPPVPAAGPRLPFADELLAAALEHSQEPVVEPITPPAEASPSPSPSLSPSPSSSPSSSAASPPRVTFSALPAEIRNAIWEEALPRRVIGLRPHSVGDGSDITPAGGSDAAGYGVSTRPAARHGSGSRMPQALANTCYESRAAVTRSGRWTIGAEGMPVWFDPKRDIILLNSRRPVDYFLLARRTMLTDPPPQPWPRPSTPTDPHGVPEVDDDLLFDVPVQAPAGPPAPLSDLPRPAAEDSEDPSRLNPMATVSIADVAQHQLVGCLDEAVRSGGGIAVHHELLRSHVGRVVFPLLKTCAIVSGGDRVGAGASLMVYFDEIAVTGTRAQAVASGLFGTATAPEEQMFFVPLRDRATLERILAASKVRPGYSPPAREQEQAEDGPFRTTSGVCRSLGGLRVGNAGFIRELLRPSHALHNLRMLAIRYLYHADQWMASLDSDPSDILIARALDAGMPPLEQAILFRFKEVAEGSEYQ